MRRRTQLTESERAAEYVPPSLTDALDFSEIFSREAAIEVDLGCGDGKFLVALAAQNPERNFLGIERLLGRVCGACRKVARMNLANVRVLRMDVGYVVEHLIQEDTVAAFYLLFPDPWPKRRHYYRRIVTGHFLCAVSRALKPEGELRIVTDDRDYFAAMQRLFLDARTNLIPAPELTSSELPVSKFEERFRELGANIYRLTLRKATASDALTAIGNQISSITSTIEK